MSAVRFSFTLSEFSKRAISLSQSPVSEIFPKNQKRRNEDVRNDGKGESNITQNGFTAYLLSAVAHRKADYLYTKQRRQAREVLTDPDDLSTEESPGISDPTDLLCCIENAALEEVLNRISERDRYIFFSRALHGRSFHELALELDLGYQGVAAAYHRVCKKVKEATGRDVK